MNRNLTKYNYDTLYSTPQQIAEFYNICLSEAKLYRCVSAYFSNDVFKCLKKGLSKFIKHDGYFQLILSKEIKAETICEIENGYKQKEQQKYALLSKEEILRELESICNIDDISIFSFLIAIGKLDVKIAYKRIGNVHDKFGLISDGKHNLAYMGSNNFTSNAIENNDEAFQVTIDWNDPSKRDLDFISKLDKLFLQYWNNQKEEVITIELPDPLITRMINKIDYDYVKKYIEITDFVRLDIDEKGQINIFTNLNDNELFTYSNFRTYSQFIVKEEGIHVLKNITKVTEIEKFCKKTKELCNELNVGYYLTYKLNNFLELHVHNYEELKEIGKKIKALDYSNTEEFYLLKKKVNASVKRPLVDKQIEAVSHIVQMERSLNFSVPGSGKTATVLGAFEYLNKLPNYEKNHVDKLLVIGPVNCSKSWCDEYAVVSYESNNHKPLNIIGCGDSYDKAQILEHDYPTSRLIIINYESVINLEKTLYKLVNDKTMIVFDEIHRIKNISSEKYKILYEVAKNTRYRVALTGTPLPNGYIDLYNIISLLHDDYTSAYFGLNHSELIKADRNYKNTGVQNYELNKLLEAFYIRVSKDDLNVPPANPDHLIEVNVNKKEKELYEKIIKEYKSYQKITKLQEVGLIPFRCFDDYEDENRNTLDFDKCDLNKYYTSKISTFLNILRHGNRKCVVWCLFIDSINLITNILKKEGYKAQAIYGDIDQDERDKIIDKFNYSNEVEIIVTNPATLAESVSLHKACHEAHYLEYNYNLYQYLQSRDRIHRLGLKKSDETNYYLYINKYTDNIEDSLDYKILQALKMKEKKMINSITNGDFLFDAGDIDLNKI